MTTNYPNLFIPGAAKSGTSALHEILNQHPDVCMSNHKEPFYWVGTNFENHTQKQKENYLNLFKSEPNTIYKGESTTAYMLFPYFIERIKKHNKANIKFIFILRNPIDRIYSHYWYVKGVGSETLDLKEAVLLDKDIEPNPTHELPEGRFKNYFQYGLYGKWLSKFYNEFNKDQIKILAFEDLIIDPLSVANECFAFLGIRPLRSLSTLHTNKTVIIKYPKIYNFILRVAQGNIKVLKPIYRLIPRSVKNSIKNNISDIIIKYTKTNEKYPKLSINERLWLKNLYKNDFDLLKKVTNKTFNQWKDFN